MLVVVTVGCVVIGWRANRLWQNLRAIKSLEQHDITVVNSEQGRVAIKDSLSIWSNVDVNSAVLYRVRPDVRYLSLTTFWADLSELHPLTSMTLIGGDLPNRADGVFHRTGNRVTEANFDFCRFKGDAIPLAIEQMPHLESLSFGLCELDPNTLATLSSCANLRSLITNDISFPPGTISKLQGKQLRKLDLSTHVGAKLELSIEDMQTLSKMENLEELSLCNYRNTGIPIAVVQHLKQCKQLKSVKLTVDEHRSSEVYAAEQELKEALPNCEIAIYGTR
jgi:hypothetical protein